MDGRRPIMDNQLFEILFQDVMKMLREKLPENLYYHSPDHTIDVIESVERIALSEGCDQKEIAMLKIAALFHDTGYVRDMRDHEKHGCDIATEKLSDHFVDGSEIKIICGIIMATRIPQSPRTKLEEIICDADLDYLGRQDYIPIAENLHREFLAFEKIKNDEEWIRLQQNFLKSHTYFTNTSLKLRQPGVENNLKEINSRL